MWELSISLVHFAMVVGIIFLFRSTPDALQKFVLAGLLIAYVCYALGDLFSLLGSFEVYYYFNKIGSYIEHGSVLLYVFRLVHRETSWKPSSNRSQSSPG